MAILNLYQSFWEKFSEKFGMTILGHSEFIPVFFQKNCQTKFGMAIFGHSEFIPVLLGKIVGKNLEQPFLAILNFFLTIFLHISL